MAAPAISRPLLPPLPASLLHIFQRDADILNQPIILANHNIHAEQSSATLAAAVTTGRRAAKASSIS